MIWKKRTMILFIAWLFLLSAGNVFSENEDYVVKIANLYKKTAVGIETTVKYQNGDKDVFEGSGFFIDLEGRILTNNHIVKDEEDTKIENDESEDQHQKLKEKCYTYWVTFEGKKYRAKLLGGDKYQDLALLKIDVVPGGVIPAKLGNSDNIQVGQKVIAFGNPYGLKNTLTAGRISALHRKNFFPGQIEDFIQTDAAINYGNSGGPLINENEEVIGINAAIIDNANNLGFAVPINFAINELEKLKKGDIEMGWLGVKSSLEKFIFSDTFEDLKILYELLDIDNTLMLTEMVKILENSGAALVELVEKESPAEDANIEKGDLIVEFNGKKITDGYDLKKAIFESPLDEDLKVIILKIDENGEVEISRKIVALISKKSNLKKAHH
ncbi:MAG: trypsin-like peptidase domain-containing protein [Parcubacteria group bacterium]|nr:trypsin-like peptidase domain-containing protein [Parcubacteria group bacterium]